jgi:hypothetical protein
MGMVEKTKQIIVRPANCSDNLLKIKETKKLVATLKNHNWENVFLDSYLLYFLDYNIYKRKISPNYFRFTVTRNDETCSFTMYEREK